MKKIKFTNELPPANTLVLITDQYDGYVLRYREDIEGENFWYDENDIFDTTFNQDLGEYNQDWEYWSEITFED